MATRRSLIIAAVAAVAVVSAGWFAMAGNLSRGVLHTSSGNHPIDIELAQTPDEREIGLMNRETLPPDQGMLFEFDEPQPVTMWMKNTLIPLDMLFMDAHGVVTHIKTNAQPLSLDLIPSGGPVSYVLELNGGAAKRYGVSLGDRLEHQIIAPPE